MSYLYLVVGMVIYIYVNLGNILDMCPIFVKRECMFTLLLHFNTHTYTEISTKWAPFPALWIQETSLTVRLQHSTHLTTLYCQLWWCLQMCNIWVIVSGILRIALQGSSCQREHREDHLPFWTGGWAKLSIVFGFFGGFLICISEP